MATPKKIFILLGHPDKETLNGALADAYEKGARDAGHEVRRVNIGDLSFDPILHKGYKVIQELEPDLKTVQEHIKWADHWVIFYPIWWGEMPALLKGFIDRTIVPGFAFKYYAKYLWHGRLRGKSARIVVTLDVPRLFPFYFKNNLKVFKRTTLRFCGIHPIRTTMITPVKGMNEQQIKHKIAVIEKLGRKGK